MTSKQFTKKQAEAAVEKVDSGYLTIDEGLTAILDGQAWVSLKYSGLLDLWRGRFATRSLGAASDPVKVAVIRTMLEQGSDPEDIGFHVKGVAPRSVAAMASKLERGIDPQTVRTYQRGGDQWAEGKKLCRELGWDWKEEVDKAKADLVRRARRAHTQLKRVA